MERDEGRSRWIQQKMEEKGRVRERENGKSERKKWGKERGKVRMRDAMLK